MRTFYDSTARSLNRQEHAESGATELKDHSSSSRYRFRLALLATGPTLMLVLIGGLVGCSPPAGDNRATANQESQSESTVPPFSADPETKNNQIGEVQFRDGTPLKIMDAKGKVLPIILAKDAAPKTEAAADELADAIESIGGVRPEIHEILPDPVPDQAIWVGYQPVLDRLFPGIDFALTEPEEIFLVGNENHIAITGRDIWDPKFSTFPGRRDPIENWQREYGNANAIYTFLQDIIGVRWLYPGELGTDYPEVENLAIQPFSLRYHPQFRFREGLFHQLARGYIKEGPMQDWAKYQRVLLHSLDFPVGHYFKDWWEKYGASRPELFALQPDGTRGTFPATKYHRKICEGEPLVWETWVNDQSEHLEQFPYDVVLGAMPNDSYFQGHCTDPRSRAWDPDPSETDIRIKLKWAGSSEEWPPLSDRYVTFANKLAEMIKDRFPDKELLVATNAYGDVGRPKPVKAVPRDDVVVLSVANFHMRDKAFREKHIQDFLNWADITKHIVWRPNLGNQGGRNWGLPDVHFQQAMEDFRLVAEHGAIGVMFDMLYENWAPMAPYYYLISQLAWNPYADGNAILDDYFKRCYGPAAEPMRDYWMMMERTTSDLIDTVASTESALSIPDFYTPEFFAKAESLIEQAKGLAEGSEKFTQRIEFTACALGFAKAITEIRALMIQFENSSGDEQKALGEKVLTRWAALEEATNAYPEFAMNFKRMRPESGDGSGNKRLQGLHPDSPAKKSALKAIKESGLDLD